MSFPVPPAPLNGTCSTIYNNTLYSYSSDAFLSLPLIRGAEWSKLPMGEPVNGAVCVQGMSTNGETPDALYIVGGTSISPGNGYSGLQRYIFSSGRWEFISPTTRVTENRLYHSAVYLNASSSILVYAGTQDGTIQPSSETFTISTLPPYTVLAFGSSGAPAVSPLLMQWSDTKAVMMGGDETNKKVMFFNSLEGWTDSGITLAQPLKNMVKAVVTLGDDGSSNLFTFDMSVAPNQVNRTVLMDGKGNPLLNAAPVLSRSLTADSWPLYNSTFVPSIKRQDYAIAKDQNDQVVLSGGTDSDEISIFSTRDNSWVDPISELSQVSLNDSPSTSATTSSDVVSTPTSTTTPPSTTVWDSTSTTSSLSNPSNSIISSSSSSSSSPTNFKILGAALGAILGILILLLIGLLLFRRYQRRREKLRASQRRSGGLAGEEKDSLDFADRGIDFGTDFNINNYGHRQQDSQGSFSSVAILMGKVGRDQKPSVMPSKKHKASISHPIPQSNLAGPELFESGDKGVSFAQDTPIPRTRAGGTARRGSTRRSSGWNRYWSGGSATNILGFGSKRTASPSISTSNWTGSQYSETEHASAMVPPLGFANPTGRMNHVASSSPTIAHAESDFSLREGIAGQIERPGSLSSVSSYGDRQDAFSSDVPSSINQDTAWSPFGKSEWEQTRAPGANSESNPQSTIGRASTSTQWPDFSENPSALPPSDMSWLNLGANNRKI